MDFEVGDHIYWTNKTGWDFTGVVLALRRFTVKVRVTLNNGPATFWTRPSRLKKQTVRRVADPTTVETHDDASPVGARRDVPDSNKGGI
jgi:hypothetical protein